jgi:hypothetical protein
VGSYRLELLILAGVIHCLTICTQQFKQSSKQEAVFFGVAFSNVKDIHPVTEKGPEML